MSSSRVLAYVTSAGGHAEVRLRSGWVAYRRLLNGSWTIVKAPLGGGPAVRMAEANPGGGTTDWSPTGQWIAHSRRDGSRLFVVKRGEDRQWALRIRDVAAGRELGAIVLPLASSSEVQGLALSPDGSRIIVGAGTTTSNIWLLEQFEPPAPLWAAWLRR